MRRTPAYYRLSFYDWLLCYRCGDVKTHRGDIYVIMFAKLLTVDRFPKTVFFSECKPTQHFSRTFLVMVRYCLSVYLLRIIRY